MRICVQSIVYRSSMRLSRTTFIGDLPPFQHLPKCQLHTSIDSMCVCTRFVFSAILYANAISPFLLEPTLFPAKSCIPLFQYHYSLDKPPEPILRCLYHNACSFHPFKRMRFLWEHQHLHRNTSPPLQGVVKPLTLARWHSQVVLPNEE